MKIVLTREEVETIRLDRINDSFGTCFDVIAFDGYGSFSAATLENAPKATVQETTAAAS